MSKKSRGIIPIIIIIAVVFQIALVILLLNSDSIIAKIFGSDEPEPGPDEDVVYNPTPVSKTLSYQLSELVIDVDNKKAFVTVDSPEDCVVLLRFVTEESFFASEEDRALSYYESCSATAEITIPELPEEDSLKVSTTDAVLDIEGILPERFVAEAVIISETGEVLSSPAYTIMHTTRYEQFKNMTPADFPETDRVIVFGDGTATETAMLSATERDGSTSENFGVLADGVKIITCESLTTVYESGYDWYTFEVVAPSEKITSGDVVYVSDGKNSQLIGVNYTETEGDTVFVHPFNYAHYELSKYYKFLKVDSCFTANGECEAELPESLVEEDTVYEKKPIEGYKKIKNFPINLTFGDAQGDKNDKKVKAEVKGTIKNGKIAVDGYYIYAPDVLGEDYFECKVRTDIDFVINAEISISTGKDDEYADIPVGQVKKIGWVTLPTPVPGLLLKAEFGTSLSGKVSGKIKIDDMPVFGKYGFKYSSKEGYTALGKSGGIKGSKDKDYIDCSAEAEIYFGPRVVLGAELLFGIVDFSADTDLTLRLAASTDTVHNYNEEEDSVIHNCELCVDADFYIHFGVNLKLGCRIAKFIAYYPVNMTIIDVQLKLGEFYVSMPEFGSSPVFGVGDCQNYSLIYNVDPRCTADEYFVCSYLDSHEDYYWKQEEENLNHFWLNVLSSIDPVTGVPGYYSEGGNCGYGNHHHFFNHAYVTITDNDTGETLFEDTLTLTRDNHNRPITKELRAKIPLSVKNMHVKVVCNCTVYECQMQKWNRYNPDSLDDYESYYPEHAVNHTVEYDLMHNFTIEEEDDFSPWGEEVEEVGYGPFGTVDSLMEFMSYALNWDFNNRLGYK